MFFLSLARARASIIMSPSKIFVLTIILPQTALAYTDEIIENGLKATTNMMSASYDTFEEANPEGKNWKWGWDFSNQTHEDSSIRTQFRALTDRELGTSKEWELVARYRPGGVFSQELGTWTMTRNFPQRTYLAMLFKNAETRTNVLVFRGTDAGNVSSVLQNLDHNLHSAGEFVSDSRALVHGGFKDIFGYHKSWIDQIVGDIEFGETIIISGHSQGGAVAYLAAAYITRQFPRHSDNVVVMTYSTAEAGNREFSSAYDQSVGCHKTFHFRVEGDPVSSANPFAEIPCKALPLTKYNNKYFTRNDVATDFFNHGELCSLVPHCSQLVRNLMETWLSQPFLFLDLEFEFYFTGNVSFSFSF